MEQNTSSGYLAVNVYTARGAIPLSGASVSVAYEASDNNSIITVMTTDMSGKTPRATLPAPSRELSETPGNAKPYATYTVTVEKDGYYTVTNTGVPIFSGVTSIQPVEMLPLAEYNSDTVYPRYGLNITESRNQNL